MKFHECSPSYSRVVPVRAVRHGEASSRFSSSFSGSVSEETNLELSFSLYLLETQIIIYEKMCSEGISSFHREVDKNCTLLVCYAACSGNSLRAFWDNLSVPTSKVKNQLRINSPLKLDRIGCPETSVRNYNYLLHNIAESSQTCSEFLLTVKILEFFHSVTNMAYCFLFLTVSIKIGSTVEKSV